MIGMLCAGPQNRPDIKLIADRFSIEPDRLISVLDWMRMQDRPELLLLQNPNPGTKLKAAVFMTSTWSYSYWKSGHPKHIRIWRDFYYQCLFSGMGFLSEAGCSQLRIENPSFPYEWSSDGLTCLFEAHNNIFRYIDPAIEINIVQHRFTQDELNNLKRKQASFTEDHRPIGISPHIHDGLNMRTIFVEKREIALSMAGVQPSST